MSPERRIVSDTGPLISLEKLTGGHHFIRLLYDTILIPPSVLHELAGTLLESPEAYLKEHGVEDLIQVRAPGLGVGLANLHRLHPAEIDAIRLAREEGLGLLIEETYGRRAAQRLGLRISGVAGQVMKANRLGLLTESQTREFLRELLAAGRINKRIFQGLIAALPQ